MNRREIAAYLRAAAEQRRLLLPRRRDRAMVARGGTVIHSVDTDVVKLYTSPWEVAVHTNHRKKGYAEIFPKEERELVIGLGTALAEFIFHTLNRRLPLVLLPPLGEEVNKVFDAIAREASCENNRVFDELDEIKRLIHEAKELPEHVQAANKLAEHADRIVRFLRGQEGATAELRRFAQLLRRARIVPPEYLIAKDMIQDPVLRRALEPPTHLTDRIGFRISREEWFDRLHEKKSEAHETVLTDADAQALARLEFINTKLTPPKPGEEPMYRLVLITGDKAIHKAGSQVSWKSSTQSFAELFLRHPKAYLGEPTVLDPPEDAEMIDESAAPETQFDQWLDTWLSELNPGTDRFEKALEELIDKNDQQLSEWVEPLSKTRPQLVEQFRASWASYTRNLVLDRKPSKWELRLASAQERGIIREYAGLITELSKAIELRVRETWEHCFSVVAEGSYRLLRARPQSSASIPSRNPPLLTFDCFPATKSFVIKVLKSYEDGTMRTKQWEYLLEELKLEDPSGYTFFLAIGLLFAADGKWRVAAILASKALSIASRKSPEKISGREAAYLRAVALRHSSRRIADLKQIGAFLTRARASYDRDLDDYPNLKGGPCRFDAERLALYLTYHLYRILMEDTITDPVPPLDEIQSSIADMLDILESSREDEEVKIYTERILLVDWLMASLLLFKEENRLLDIIQFAAFHQRLAQNVERWSDTLKPSYYVRAILLVGSVLVAQDVSIRSARKKDACDWLNQDAVEWHSVMRYDADRFQLLRDIVEGRIN